MEEKQSYLEEISVETAVKLPDAVYRLVSYLRVNFFAIPHQEDWRLNKETNSNFIRRPGTVQQWFFNSLQHDGAGLKVQKLGRDTDNHIWSGEKLEKKCVNYKYRLFMLLEKTLTVIDHKDVEKSTKTPQTRSYYNRNICLRVILFILLITTIYMM